MPVPTSPVRPVLAKLRRVRTWLPSLSLAAATLAMLVGWAGATHTGAALSGPALAWALIAPDSPEPGCGDSWRRWAALMRGFRVSEPLRCAEQVAPAGFRLRAIEAQARAAHTPRAARGQLVELLMVHPAVSDTSLERAILSAGLRGYERAELFSPASVELSPLDLVRWTERTALGGAFDRSILLDDADSLRAADLQPLSADLSAAERALLVDLAAAFPERRSVGPGAPPPAVTAPAPAERPAPAPLGVLALVPERARDHVAAEWAALVAFVAEGPTTPELTGPVDRWRLASVSAPRELSGPAPASVHAVLRGEPATAEIGAWITLSLARDAGLPAETFVQGSRLDVTIGTATIRTSACGQRFPVASGTGTPLPEAELRQRAVAAAATAALADGDLGLAQDLLASLAAPPPALALAVELVALPPGWTPPPPAPPRRRKRGAPVEPVPPPEPTPAERAAALESRGAALPPEERALLAAWAEFRGHRALAEAWSTESATGPAEAVRRRLRARLADPAATSEGGPVRAEGGCQDADWPWPPGT